MQHILQNYVISKIKQTLIEKAITQSQLAERLSISRQQLSKYLTSRTEITLKMVELICGALDILPGDLFFDFFSYTMKDSNIVNEPDKNYSQIQTLKSDILKLQKRIKELEKDKSILQRTVDIVESQYQRKCIELDKCETMLSEANREK